MVEFGEDWLEIVMLDAMKISRNDLGCLDDVPVEKETGNPL